MATIDKLTPEQESQIEVYNKRWLDYGLTCESADRSAAEAAVLEAYDSAKLPRPKDILWARSPQEGALLAARRANSTKEPTKEQLGSAYDNSCFGQHDAGWLAFYAFCREVLGLEKETDELVPLFKLAQSCGWWYPYSDFVVLCERPLVCKIDDRQRLHCADGPAIAYPDGFKLYVWHGIQVDARFIEHPETITVQDIQSQTNAELRRVLIERYGFDGSPRYRGTGKYLKDAGAKVLDRVPAESFDHPVGLLGSALYRMEVRDDEPIVMIELQNSTPEPDGSHKTYFLEVPPSIKTCKEAVAWTFDQKPDDYQPSFES